MTLHMKGNRPSILNRKADWHRTLVLVNYIIRTEKTMWFVAVVIQTLMFLGIG